MIDVWPVQLPGRAPRLRELAYTSMDGLVDALETALLEHLDKPFAFFGHSMGAVISFELIHRLMLKWEASPIHLFVSGRMAPQIACKESQIFALPDADFLKEIRRLNGTPPQVLDNQGFVQLLLPLLRADFQLIETYTYMARTPLTCPITAFGGYADTSVSHQDLRAWCRQSSGPFRMHMFPGDHFFIHQEQDQMLEIIGRHLGARPQC